MFRHQVPTSSFPDILFKSESVVVTPTVATIGDYSYRIEGISRILIEKTTSVWNVIVILIAVAAGIFSVEDHSNTLLVLAAGVMAITVLSLVFSPNTLIIQTPSGLQQALFSRDRTYLRSIRSAMEKGMQMQGMPPRRDLRTQRVAVGNISTMVAELQRAQAGLAAQA